MSSSMFRFALGKLVKPLVVITSWALVIATPFVAARFGLFNALLIEGRCIRPSLAACGQDNAALAYAGLTVFVGAFATVVTAAVFQWDELKEEYAERCKQDKPKGEPERVEWRWP